MIPLRIIFTGSGEFGLPTLRALVGVGYEVVQVVSQPDRPAGRGRKLTPTPIAQWAIENSLPLVRTENINGEVLPGADVMVVIAFGQKIGDAVVNHPRLGSVNLHSSRLPKYRGAAPINWAIIRGEKISGNSVIRLAQKMDAGAILAQSEIAIGETETAGELHDRLAEDGGPLVLRVLEELATGRSRECVQDETQATLAPKMNREMSRLDWGRAAGELCCQIRGMSPWPGCRVRLVDAAGGEHGRMTLVRAKVGEGEGPRWCGGEIMSNGLVCAGDGNVGVEIVECQPEGKRPMLMGDYRRGHQWQPGMRLESIA